MSNTPIKLPKPFTRPDPDVDPRLLTCEVQACPHRGTQQIVIGAWDHPQSFPDPSRIFLLNCGHQSF